MIQWCEVDGYCVDLSFNEEGNLLLATTVSNGAYLMDYAKGGSVLRSAATFTSPMVEDKDVLCGILHSEGKDAAFGSGCGAFLNFDVETKKLKYRNHATAPLMSMTLFEEVLAATTPEGIMFADLRQPETRPWSISAPGVCNASAILPGSHSIALAMGSCVLLMDTRRASTPFAIRQLEDQITSLSANAVMKGTLACGTVSGRIATLRYITSSAKEAVYSLNHEVRTPICSVSLCSNSAVACGTELGELVMLPLNERDTKTTRWRLREHRTAAVASGGSDPHESIVASAFVESSYLKGIHKSSEDLISKISVFPHQF